MTTIKRIVASLMFFLLLSAVQGQQTCAIWNSNWLGTGFNMYGAQGHTGVNQHGLSLAYPSSCTYQGVFPGQACGVSCYIDGRQLASRYENKSTIINVLQWHSVGSDGTTGSAFSPSGSVNCSAEAAVAVTSCSIFFTTCPSTVTIGAGGGSISWPTNPIFKNSNSDSLFCPSEYAPILGTPILIDIDGKGFKLSSYLEGVPFDFFGTGLIWTAWPQPGSTNGFLVLPDADGMVRTGKQMFGNQTGYANGFLQLKQYDDNHDGKIDPNDSVYDLLRVWVDTNRDGISQPEELHRLRDLGIEGISTQYTTTRFVDDNGNAFRYRGTLIRLPGDDVDRVIYDVVLTFGMPVPK